MQTLKFQRGSIAALGVAAILGATASTSALAAVNGGNGYVELVEDVSPAVVFVKVAASVQKADAETGPRSDPRFEEFMKRFGGEIAPQARRAPRRPPSGRRRGPTRRSADGPPPRDGTWTSPE